MIVQEEPEPVPAECVVSIAFTNGADLLALIALLTPSEVNQLDGVLQTLVSFGVVAAFSVATSKPARPMLDTIDTLRARCGPLTVDAALRAGKPRFEPAATYLLPAWPFDHDRGGWPASTAKFLSLDLELLAFPSPDEEVGITIPGRAGQWLVRARALF
jgi:hypothetical protein